jgi:hypothetical protein
MASVNVTIIGGSVQPDGDGVVIVGTISGINNPDGTPKQYQVHAWLSHLNTLATNAAKLGYVAPLIKQAAIQAGDIAGASVVLAGTVSV